MRTEVIDARRMPEAGTQKGGELIRNGELVAFPTETVYGLGADGLNKDAVRKIFEAKGRPNDNPLILHITAKNDARRLWDTVPKKAQQLMDAFWPGPLTLVYTRSLIVPDEVTAGLDTVALRMPENKTARALIKAANTPIAAPSANASGKPSPTLAQHVMEDMDGKIPLIIDGGQCAFGMESTVLAIGSTPVLLRPGMITKSMIEAVTGTISLHKSLLNPLEKGEEAASPGMKYRHYAPEAAVNVVGGQIFPMARRIAELYDYYTDKGESCIIFATEQTQRFYQGRYYVIIGDRNSPETLCANLFSCLRENGGEKVRLLCEGVPPEEVGLAYMNRLLRASGFEYEEAWA